MIRSRNAADKDDPVRYYETFAQLSNMMPYIEVSGGIRAGKMELQDSGKHLVYNLIKRRDHCRMFKKQFISDLIKLKLNLNT